LCFIVQPKVLTMLLNWKLIISILAIKLSFVFSRDLLIRTQEGWVSGSIMETYSGRRFYAYRSIPYAEAPIGELRFKV
jgi:hypothetical protein